MAKKKLTAAEKRREARHAKERNEAYLRGVEHGKRRGIIEAQDRIVHALGLHERFAAARGDFDDD